jgi:hypothetical protein
MKPLRILIKYRTEHLARLKNENEIASGEFDKLIEKYPYLKTHTWLVHLLKIEWKAAIIRFVLLFVTSSWLAFLPAYVFAIYMHKKHFFSYDLFTNGIFGINTFTFTTILLLVIISFYLFGFLILGKYICYQYIKEGKFYLSLKFQFYLYLAISITINLFVIFSIVSASSKELYITILITAFLIALYINSFIHTDLKKGIVSWKPAFALILVTAILPIIFQDKMVKIVEIGLISFNVGANKKVVVYSGENEKKTTEGNLLFLSPNYIYIQKKLSQTESELHICPNLQNTHIIIQNNT